MKIVIVDYGMGNIHSLCSALNFLGASEVFVSNQREEIVNAEKLILPGVGAFSEAMQNIKKINLDQYLNIAIIDKKIPVLGVCLGMQLMGKSSTENGYHDGLGYINGKIDSFNDQMVKIPHVGFNQVIVNSDFRLYQHIRGNIDFYFTHSYKINSEENINACFCEYGENFIASYEKDNIAGVQFHPELSQKNGLKLLKNFIEKF